MPLGNLSVSTWNVQPHIKVKAVNPGSPPPCPAVMSHLSPRAVSFSSSLDPSKLQRDQLLGSEGWASTGGTGPAVRSSGLSVCRDQVAETVSSCQPREP